MAEEDIIFGKNRHFFGGIEPSNMKEFSISLPSTGSVASINIVIPDDTVIDGQTLCTVAGAVIRKGYADYPKNEFDGEYISTVTSKERITISDSFTTNVPCFYAAFPYTTQGVYNRSSVNRISIFEPRPLVSFSVRPRYDGGVGPHARISGTFPKGVYGGLGGVMIRRSTTSYPIDENDGVLVTNIIWNGTTLGQEFYYDDYVDAGTYYYTSFVYNKNGVYNRSPLTASVRVNMSTTWLYGYDLDTNDSNPNTRVTYPGDVDNATFNPVSHTGNNIPNGSDDYKFSYGSWNECGFMPKPCMLTYKGTVGEYLDPDDYSKTIDGGDSHVSDKTYGGNAMMEWGKIWTKRWEDNFGIYHFRCSNEQIDEDYDCWCNYDKNNNQIDHFYTAIYPAFYDSTSSRYRSLSIGTPSVGVNLSYMMTNAEKNGSGWTVECASDRLLIQDLLVLIGKSTDTQTVFGGCDTVNNSNNPVTIGMLNSKGLFYEYGMHVKVFGMEQWWGSYGRALPNWKINSGKQYIKITAGTHDGSTVTGFGSSVTSPGNVSGFIDLSSKIPAFTTTSSLQQYIKKMKTFPYGRIPYYDDGLGGSATTYECDVLTTPNENYTRAVNNASKVGKSASTPDSGLGAFTMNSVQYDSTPNYVTCALAYKANSTT